MQPGDVLETFADVDDLTRDIDFRPKTRIEDGIDKFVALVSRVPSRLAAAPVWPNWSEMPRFSRGRSLAMPGNEWHLPNLLAELFSLLAHLD